MRRYLGGILLSAIIVYIGIIYESTAIVLLGFAEAAFVVLSLFYLLIVCAKLSIILQEPILFSEKGENQIRLKIDDPLVLPVARIDYCFQVDNPCYSKKQRLWVRGDHIYSGKQVQEARLQLPYSGDYEISLRAVRVFDLFGFYARKMSVKESVHIQVLPEPQELLIEITESTRNFYGDSDVYDDFHSGTDKNEMFGVREFRAGDKIQRIHWKLSAKTEELMVREDSRPLACPIVLLLDCDRIRGEKGADCYLTIAASITFTLMEKKCPHYICWYRESEQDIVRIRVDDEESYYSFLVNYLQDCGKTRKKGRKKQEDPIKKRYGEKYRYEHPLYLLMWKSDLTLWMDEQMLAIFHENKWQEEIKTLEMIC